MTHDTWHTHAGAAAAAAHATLLKPHKHKPFMRIRSSSLPVLTNPMADSALESHDDSTGDSQCNGMQVRVCVCMCVCVYACMHACAHVCVCEHVCVCLCADVYTRKCRLRLLSQFRMAMCLVTSET